MNEYFFNLIYGLSGKNSALDFIGVFLAEYLIFILFLFTIAYLFYKKSALKDYLYILIVSFIAWIASQLIKTFHFFSRPLDNTSSFPSGHTTLAFALAFSFYFFIYKKNKNFLNKIIVIIIVIIAALVGIARVYTGKHWPFDILGGAILGFLVPHLFYQYKIKKIRAR